MLGVELLVASAASGMCCWRTVKRACGSGLAAAWAALAVLLLALGLSQLDWGAAPELLAPPGSRLTRMVLPLSPEFRRACEPVLWGLLVLIALCRYLETRFAAKLLLAAALGAVAIVAATGGALRIDGVAALSDSLQQLETIGGQLAVSAMLGASIVACGAATMSTARCSVLRGLLCPLIGLALSVLSPVLLLRHRSELRPLLAGVHFYSWFPDNWPAGFVGEKLVPEELPALGRYESGDPQVFRQQLTWMRSARVNLIAFDWWAKRTSLRKQIEKNVATLTENDPQFLIQYEPHDLKDPWRRAIPDEPENTVVMNAERQKELITHWRHLAKRFFRHPRYLRFDGRPVLIIYASRHIVGDLAGAITAARAAVKAEIGVEPYVIGDEIYFNVLDFDDRRGVYLMAEEQPNWRRLAAFDGITCYNGFDASRPEHGGSAGVAKYLDDMDRLYAHYRDVAAVLGIGFFPGVLPGYNDRGVRLIEDHAVFPRFLASADAVPNYEHTFFGASLERLVGPYLLGANRMFLVTSWNEWNEGSAIEPSTLSEPSLEDASGAARSYTRGEWHAGYGTRFLEELSAFIERSEAGHGPISGHGARPR